MASVTRSRASRPRLSDRLSNFWRSYFAPGDLVTLPLAVILLLMPAYSLMEAGWALAPNTLIPVVISSVVFGFVLARSQYNELLGLLISTLYGGCVVLLLSGLSLGVGWDGLYQAFYRLLTWLADVVNSGINQDDLVFTMLVSSLFWSLGYNLAWHLFRVDRVWRAVIPPALILISNSVYYTGDANLEPYLIAFVFLVLLLIVRSNLEAREWEWYVNGIRVPRRLRRQVFAIGTVLALIVLVAAWIVPRSDLEDRLERFQEFLQAEPLQQLTEFWNRLFSSVETQGPTTSDYYGGDSLQLGGAIRLGDEVVFLVNTDSSRRYYWRSRVYDFYDGGRWTSAADTRLTDPEAPLEITQESFGSAARVPVEQVFTMGLSASRLVYTAPQPLRVDLPTRTDLRYATDSSMVISVIRPLRVIYQGDTYRASSAMSEATGAQLNAAGENYPQWVRDTYTPYIPSITSRTIQLTTQIIAQAGAVTPYEKARAIESWLRSNMTYNEAIPQPPLGQDPVDWFLFDIQQGYCNYYASAMVVMLRSQGIPARMAAGFAQGNFDPSENAFVVRERDAHTWVEVYFPGYGWIEFEPTSAQAPISRGDEPVAIPEAPTPTPSQPPPTPTPTDTPTPEPSPTPPPQSEATPDALEQQSIPPTVTPTYTPSPTATPAIIPTQPPPVRPPPRDALSLLIPAIGAVVAVMLAILALFLIGLILYWWWEWRGMRGLSPVSRAYARLMRYVPLIGVRTTPEQTPEERRQRIVRVIPIAEPPVNAITSLYTAERYGRPADAPSADESRREAAGRAWEEARGSILKRWLRKRLLFWKRD